MSDVSWWERQLSRVVPSRPAAPVPAQQPVGYPQKAVRWQPQYPPTGPRQEVAEWDQSEGDPDDNWHRVHRQGFVDKAPTHTGKDSRCPQCHGSNYFRRRVGSSEAAPLCTECGYNGDLWEQSGTTLNGAGVKSTGPVQFARSDNPEARERFGVDPSLNGTDFSWSSVR